MLYRIATANNIGVFAGLGDEYYMNNSKLGDSPADNHPSPNKEFYGIKSIHESLHDTELLFAFNSLRDLIKVFPDRTGRKAMKAEGFHIWKIEGALVVWNDDIQSAFVEGTGTAKIIA